MKKLLKYLPKGWQDKATEVGAMERDSGSIRTAKSLLRLNMLYATNGGSFQTAAIGMELTEKIRISKTAAHKKKSGAWLRSMAMELCAKEGMTIPKPEFLGKNTVALIDATDEAVKGSRKSDYRLHFALDLFNFKAKTMELTGIEGPTQTASVIKELLIYYIYVTF